MIEQPGLSPRLGYLRRFFLEGERRFLLFVSFRILMSSSKSLKMVSHDAAITESFVISSINLLSSFLFFFEGLLFRPSDTIIHFCVVLVNTFMYFFYTFLYYFNSHVIY